MSNVATATATATADNSAVVWLLEMLGLSAAEQERHHSNSKHNRNNGATVIRNDHADDQQHTVPSALQNMEDSDSGSNSSVVANSVPFSNSSSLANGTVQQQPDAVVPQRADASSDVTSTSSSGSGTTTDTGGATDKVAIESNDCYAVAEAQYAATHDDAEDDLDDDIAGEV
jgi:hypothetical protein